MSKLYSSTEIIAALKRAGFLRKSQRGSHLKLVGFKEGLNHTVIVKHPAHEIPMGTFHSILKQAGLSLDEFKKLLGRES